MTITISARSLFGKYVDGVVQGYLPKHSSESRRQQLEHEFRALQQTIEQVERDQVSIRESRELTDEGKATRLQALATKLAPHLATLRTKATQTRERATTTRDAILRGLVPDASGGFTAPKAAPRSFDEALLESERRMEARQLPPLRRDQEYLAALTDGDQRTVRAYESDSERLISPDTRARAAALKLERSPHRQLLEDVELEAHVLEYVADIAARSM
jgi:hypothetical protein